MYYIMCIYDYQYSISIFLNLVFDSRYSGRASLTALLKNKQKRDNRTLLSHYLFFLAAKRLTVSAEVFAEPIDLEMGLQLCEFLLVDRIGLEAEEFLFLSGNGNGNLSIGNLGQGLAHFLGNILAAADGEETGEAGALAEGVYGAGGALFGAAMVTHFFSEMVRCPAGVDVVAGGDASGLDFYFLFHFKDQEASATIATFFLDGFLRRR